MNFSIELLLLAVVFLSVLIIATRQVVGGLPRIGLIALVMMCAMSNCAIAWLPFETVSSISGLGISFLSLVKATLPILTGLVFFLGAFLFSHRIHSSENRSARQELARGRHSEFFMGWAASSVGAVSSLVIWSLSFDHAPLSSGAGAEILSNILLLVGASVGVWLTFTIVHQLKSAHCSFDMLLSFRAKALAYSWIGSVCIAAIFFACIPSVSVAQMIGFTMASSIASGSALVVLREPQLFLSYVARELLANNSAHGEGGVTPEMLNQALSVIQGTLQQAALSSGDRALLEATHIHLAGNNSSPITISTANLVRPLAIAEAPGIGDAEQSVANEPSGWREGREFASRRISQDTNYLLRALGDQSLGQSLGIDSEKTTAGQELKLTDDMLSGGLELAAIEPLIEFVRARSTARLGREFISVSSDIQLLLARASSVSSKGSGRMDWRMISGEQHTGRHALASIMSDTLGCKELVGVDCGSSSELAAISSLVAELSGLMSAHNIDGEIVNSKFSLLISGLEELSRPQLNFVVESLWNADPKLPVFFRVDSKKLDPLLEVLADIFAERLENRIETGADNLAAVPKLDLFEISPLRSRPMDILYLLSHYVSREAKRGGIEVTRIEPTAIVEAVQHPLPKNIEDLKGLAVNGVARSSGGLIWALASSDQTRTTVIS